MSGTGVVVDPDGSVGMLGNFPAVVVHSHGAGVVLSPIAGEALSVIADVQNDLLGNQALADKIKHQQLRHLADD